MKTRRSDYKSKCQSILKDTLGERKVGSRRILHGKDLPPPEVEVDTEQNEPEFREPSREKKFAVLTSVKFPTQSMDRLWENDYNSLDYEDGMAKSSAQSPHKGLHMKKGVSLENSPPHASPEPPVKRRTVFSLSSRLSRAAVETTLEKLNRAISNGNLLEVGRLIRRGGSNGELSEVQIENAMRTEEAQSLSQLNATVNSLSQNLVRDENTDVLEKKRLDTTHKISSVSGINDLNLTHFYESVELIGHNYMDQVAHIISRIFRKITTPRYLIWTRTYRPMCVRKCDKHFTPLPETFIKEIQAFISDILGIYMPDELQSGAIDMKHEFLSKLDCADLKSEMQRRRDLKAYAVNATNYAITQSLHSSAQKGYAGYEREEVQRKRQ
uniref:Uncharacterized protein n=1 Tax=Caenorhabditis japonica TaxID=281687 RepID=A0A8R1I692_CAEJA